MIDLSCGYMGLALRSPVVPSASPLSRDIGLIRSMEDAGAGAVVLPSLFAEKLDVERCSGAYLEHVRKAKAAVAIPVIASLNGDSPGEWTEFAERIQEAGADALELNIYSIPQDVEVSGTAVEEDALALVRAVRGRIAMPLAVKIGPHYSALGNMAKRFAQAGADALVLFNRFYQPDLDLRTLAPRCDVRLSVAQELRLPLCWTALLHGRVDCGLAVTGGVSTHEDVLKALLAGADAVMMCSELLRAGVHRIEAVLRGVRGWMELRSFPSVAIMKGALSRRALGDRAEAARDSYIQALTSARGGKY